MTRLKRIGLFITAFITLFLTCVYISVANNKNTQPVCEVLNVDNVESTDFRNLDSVIVAANFSYKGTNLKKFMQGEHYREAWQCPIMVPVVFLDSIHGGLEVIDVGGGNQTHSLDLKSKDGIIYTLRSVNKDPSKFIPDFLKTVGLENLVTDGISAQHPYGAIIAASLSEVAGVLHTNPKLVFVPRQDALDTLNYKFGNGLFLLEFETEGEVNYTKLSDIENIIETEDLVEMKMDKVVSIKIDRAAFIRARLFDFLIGDWDRHSKQWGWAIQSTPDGRVAIPIAGDRDNAFYNIGGIIPSIVGHKNINTELRPFDNDIDYLPGMVKGIDMYMLLDTPEEIFINEALHLQSVLTDGKIESALSVWPDKIYEIDGQEIKEKMISRREKLVDYAKRFKQIIDENGPNTKALSAFDDMDIPESLIACFECGNKLNNQKLK